MQYSVLKPDCYNAITTFNRNVKYKVYKEALRLIVIEAGPYVFLAEQ